MSTMPPRRTPCEPWTDDRGLFLDRLHEQLLDHHDIPGAMDALSDGLWFYRRCEPESWRPWLAAARSHPLHRVVLEDPFTSRAFQRPRGYAGDAPLLDLIYYDQGFADVRALSERGHAIFWRNRDAPAPRAVRERRDHMATLLDSVALRRPSAKVMAVAAGHFREGLKSTAVMTNALTQVVAMDQDVESLDMVRRCLGGRVQCRPGSIRDLCRKVETERFDLIYAAGLFDYLEDRLAARVVRRLCDQLAPDGRLVIANFVPDILDSGYMEAYMGWDLIYRTPAQLAGLLGELSAESRGSASIYFLGMPDICYLDIRR